MASHLIIGAGGAVANTLAKALLAKGEEVILFSRRGTEAPNMQAIKGDVRDKAAIIAAMKKASVAYLVVGLRYSSKIWERDWPVIMANCLDGAESTGCALVFLDNVYAYGAVDGEMTEQSPYRPCSRKGRVRATIAQAMQYRMAANRIKGMIVRAADFYGPKVGKVSVPGQLVFDRLAQRRSPQALVNAQMPHSFTFVPDIGTAMVRLAQSSEAWGQVWHLPTHAPAITGKEFGEIASSVMGQAKKVSVVSRWMIQVLGWFIPAMREMQEMLYQYDRPYHFSSAKIQKAFDLHPTSYEEGIRQTAATYGRLQEPRYLLSL